MALPPFCKGIKDLSPRPLRRALSGTQRGASLLRLHSTRQLRWQTRSAQDEWEGSLLNDGMGSSPLGDRERRAKQRQSRREAAGKGEEPVLKTSKIAQSFFN